MPLGKPAGTRCVQLDEANRCKLFGEAGRPEVGRSLQPSSDMCGDSREQAMRWLGYVEALTAPEH